MLDGLHARVKPATVNSHLDLRPEPDGESNRLDPPVECDGCVRRGTRRGGDYALASNVTPRAVPRLESWLPQPSSQQPTHIKEM